jgi:hypothetical protein
VIALTGVRDTGYREEPFDLKPARQPKTGSSVLFTINPMWPYGLEEMR